MNNRKESVGQVIKTQTGMEISPAHEEKLAGFLDYLLTENEKYNLTAIRDPEKAIVLHLADSLTVSEYIPAGTLCDIGAGAGFPSLPLAICREDLQVTSIDATQKKVNFMQNSAFRADIGNFHAICGRAEDIFASGASLRESFDTVVARAVAPLNILAELCAPAVRLGGQWIAMKGENAEEELGSFEKAAKKLGLSLETIVKKELHYGGETFTRFLLVFRKDSSTAASLPRAFAQIKKKPLF